MILRGLFFDWDGTLVDSFEANFKAYQEAFRTLGFELSEEQYRSSYGQNIQVFSRALIPNIKKSDVDLISKVKLEKYKNQYSRIKVNRPLIDFAFYMKKCGQKISLVTNAGKRNVQPLLEHLQLVELFDLCLFAEDVNKFKPNPEGYLKALDHFGFEKVDVIAFEDSSCGIEAAAVAGIKVVKVKI